MPVRPEQARLPTAETRLVREQEVEERADVGLARGEPERVRELGALVDSPAACCRVALRDRVEGPAVGLLPRVVRCKVPAYARLEAVLHVPDRHALARHRLGGSRESLGQHLDELVVVALADRSAVVPDPRRLGRGVRVRVVADRVEDGPVTTTGSISGRQLGIEEDGGLGRSRRGRIVVPARSARRDHVHSRPEHVKLVPALRQQSLVGRRGRARSVRTELGPPEPRRVGFVPDHDVVHGRRKGEELDDEAAIGTTEPGDLRRVRRLRVDGQHEPSSACGLLRPAQGQHGRTARIFLAGRPAQRHPDRAHPEVRHVPPDERRSHRRPLHHVLGDSDQEAVAGMRRGRREDGGEDCGG